MHGTSAEREFRASRRLVICAVALLATSCGRSASRAQIAAQTVRAHAMYATDPPGALEARTVEVGSFRDLLENRTVDGYVQKRYYSAAEPLDAVLEVVRHARRVGGSIAKIDCTARTAGVSGTFIAGGIRQDFGAGASIPVPSGDVLETGTSTAPIGARSFVTIQTTPYGDAPGALLRSSSVIECPADRLSDDFVRTLLGTTPFVRAPG